MIKEQIYFDSFIDYLNYYFPLSCKKMTIYELELILKMHKKYKNDFTNNRQARLWKNIHSH